MVFVASTLLPEPNQLIRVDHISALLSLAVDEPILKAAIKLLAPANSQEEAEYAWATWAPHLSPTPDHPLAAGKLLRGAVMQTMRTP